MYQIMTNEQLHDCLQKNLRLIVKIENDTTLTHLQRKDKVCETRNEIAQVMKEQRFRTKLRMKMQTFEE